MNNTSVNLHSYYSNYVLYFYITLHDQMSVNFGLDRLK